MSYRQERKQGKENLDSSVDFLNHYNDETVTLEQLKKIVSVMPDGVMLCVSLGGESHG